MDALRDRAAEMNKRVSCSVIGDGPGTGGNGVDGGRDNGGLGLGNGLPNAADIGVEGMKDGGTGNEERRSGTASRLSSRRGEREVIATSN